MKKLFLFLILITFCYCSSGRIQVIDTTSGELMTLIDQHNISKIGDTIVVQKSTATLSSSLYGMYIGVIPSSVDYKYNGEKHILFYTLAKRIK